MDEEKLYLLGLMIDEIDNRLFFIPKSQIAKCIKDNKTDYESARRYLKSQAIMKYRKSLWYILEIWKSYLMVSEYRVFLKWAFTTFKQISLISMKNIFGNEKILYRFNKENKAYVIGKNIDDTLSYIHLKSEYYNDYEFIDDIKPVNRTLFFTA